MLPVTDRLLNDVVEKLSRDLEELEEIHLFGSRARGETDPQADVDLLLIVDLPFGPGGVSRWEYVKRVRQALSPFPFPVDFRVFNIREVERYRRHENHLVSVALEEGRSLYRRRGMAAVA